MVRSRKGCPGQLTSIIPVLSRTTAWKIRSPFLVGMTPLDTTRPITVASIPGERLEMLAIVLASSYRRGMWKRRSPAV